ncbi:MAG TPA: DUF4920 domain-containing protein [Thermoanaerobaculia bacterium]|nr:DUF4920 domain-containing protein [Thermoanaerobaculia bacterium]
MVFFAVSPTRAAVEQYGAGVTLAESTSLARLMAAPEQFEGKQVRVEGSVLDVCPKKGCWLKLGAEGSSVRVKVEDDVIVFPRSAKGQKAVVEGTVKIVRLSREEFSAWLAHQAEERGERFDPASVGEGPYRIIEIAGSGARIGEP